MKKKDDMKEPTFVYRDGMLADKEYVEWLADVKARFRQSQIKASIRVNTDMLEFYWSIGRDLVALRAEERWGAGVVKQFALDMRQTFPDATGFSHTNVKYMKQWYSFYYKQVTKSQQVVGQNHHQVGDAFGKFAGKLNFYVTAADKLLRGEGDNQSVGLIICKSTDKTVVEWSLQDIKKPLGVATYQLQEVVDRTVAELEQRKKQKEEEIG